jgi:hypothetical protein
VQLLEPPKRSETDESCSRGLSQGSLKRCQYTQPIVKSTSRNRASKGTGIVSIFGATTLNFWGHIEEGENLATPKQKERGIFFESPAPPSTLSIGPRQHYGYDGNHAIAPRWEGEAPQLTTQYSRAAPLNPRRPRSLFFVVSAPNLLFASKCAQ